MDERLIPPPLLELQNDDAGDPNVREQTIICIADDPFTSTKVHPKFRAQGVSHKSHPTSSKSVAREGLMVALASGILSINDLHPPVMNNGFYHTATTIFRDLSDEVFNKLIPIVKGGSHMCRFNYANWSKKEKCKRPNEFIICDIIGVFLDAISLVKATPKENKSLGEGETFLGICGGGWFALQGVRLHRNFWNTPLNVSHTKLPHHRILSPCHPETLILDNEGVIHTQVSDDGVSLAEPPTVAETPTVAEPPTDSSGPVLSKKTRRRLLMKHHKEMIKEIETIKIRIKEVDNAGEEVRTIDVVRGRGA